MNDNNIINLLTDKTSNYTNDQFINLMQTNNNKISVVIGCKNRNDNLIKSVKSYINYDIISEIVIVDFNSKEPIFYTLQQNDIDTTKIKIIKIDNEVPWILTYCINLGVLFCKNQYILKLDADVMFTSQFYDYLRQEQLDHNSYYTFDWERAKSINNRHLNGNMLFSKNKFMEINGFDINIVTYGWDDSDIKNKFKNSGCQNKKLNMKFLQHMEGTDEQRVENQCLIINGYNFKNLDNYIYVLILYNQFLTQETGRNYSEYYWNQFIKMFKYLDEDSRMFLLELNLDQFKNHITNKNCCLVNGHQVELNNNERRIISTIYLQMLKKLEINLSKYINNKTSTEFIAMLFYVFAFDYKKIEEKSEKNGDHIHINLKPENDEKKIIKQICYVMKNILNVNVECIFLVLEKGKDCLLYDAVRRINKLTVKIKLL
jgi:N-terminal domain of galactosyltransferase